MRFVCEETRVVVGVDDGGEGFVYVCTFGEEDSIGVDNRADSALERLPGFGTEVLFYNCTGFLEEMEVDACG